MLRDRDADIVANNNYESKHMQKVKMMNINFVGSGYRAGRKLTLDRVLFWIT